MQRQRLQEVGPFEHVETPGAGRGREARFGRLVVFEDDGCVSDGVGFGGEFAGGCVVWFLLFGRVGCGVGGGWVFVEGCLLGGEGGIVAL